MGLFNSSILLSESDLNDAVELTFLLRSTFQRDPHGHGHDHFLAVNNSEEESKSVDDDDNGFKTPTSLEHKIPTSLRCPLAPRKPKSRPLTKRKAAERQRLLLDLSGEIQSLFPPDFLVGLGGKIKRVRQETK